MPLIRTESGTALHVQDVGAGRPLVMLAGFGLNHQVWDGQVLALGATHRVLCVDLRGTGRSDKPYDGYTMDDLAGDVIAVIAALDLHDVTLVGYSFGGQVGLKVARAAADRVSQLVMVCSNGVRSCRGEAFPFGRDADALETTLVRGEREARVASRRRNVESAFKEPPDEGLLDWLVRQQLEMPSWAAVACYRTYVHSDLTHELGELRVPLRQIMGRVDPVSPAEGAAWVQERVADGRLVTLDCGHYPMFEARADFDAALTEFVREADRAAA